MSPVNNETNAQGVESKPIAIKTSSSTNTDPFAGQRKGTVQNGSEKTASPTSAGSSPVDRRLSADEWDASKTPPSRFQHRKGSMYATPSSRDGHVDKNKERDKSFHEVVATMKSGLFGGRRKSSSKGSDVEKKPDVEVEK